MTLHEALKAIREDVETQRFHIADKGNGICDALGVIDRSERLKLRFSELYEKWPLRGRNRFYPVPHPKYGPMYAFLHASKAQTMWDMRTAYGRNRMALLEWAIEQTAPEVVE